VVWASATRFGVKSFQPIDVDAFTAGPELAQKTYGPPRLQVGFYGVLSSLRQRIRSRERAHGQDGHPRVWSLNKDFGIKCHFFDRAFQTPFDCQAIFTILPANLVGYAREGAAPI
jgi:hypothetical protein